MNKTTAHKLNNLLEKHYKKAIANFISSQNKLLFGDEKLPKDTRTPLRKLLDRFYDRFLHYRMKLASFIAGFDVTERDY